MHAGGYRSPANYFSVGCSVIYLFIIIIFYQNKRFAFVGLILSENENKPVRKRNKIHEQTNSRKEMIRKVKVDAENKETKDSRTIKYKESSLGEPNLFC